MQSHFRIARNMGIPNTYNIAFFSTSYTGYFVKITGMFEVEWVGAMVSHFDEPLVYNVTPTSTSF